MKTAQEWVKNYDALATTPSRRDALAIAAAGLSAIDTEYVIKDSVKIVNTPTCDVLDIKGNKYELSKFRSIHLIGFGKVVCKATASLEMIFGDRLTSGIVIGNEKAVCNTVESFTGSHPLPSKLNVEASGAIVTLSEGLGENDLVIVVVSGGGSAMLCWPPEECEQGQKLYEEFLKTGGTIAELNTIRKHISSVKGGGLAKILYPATVVGLIFSDVPGSGDSVYAEVASGPTYRDSSTVVDAEAVLARYHMQGYKLNETPKEDMYFTRVTNIPLVSNHEALQAMASCGKELGYDTTIVSDTVYDAPEKALDIMFSELTGSKKLILAGGEPMLQVPANHGKGGRNEHIALLALDRIGDSQTFYSLASDGHDNNTAAGAIADITTRTKVTAASLDTKTYVDNFDAYSLFEKTGDLIVTGSTEANVSDLMVLLSNN